MSRFVLSAAAALALSGVSVQGQVILHHGGSADPLTEGWAGTVAAPTTVGPVVSNAPFVRAWAISDGSTNAGAGFYSHNLTTAQDNFAAAHGWKMRVCLRYAPLGAGTQSMWVGYNRDTRRFDMWFSQSGGNTVVTLMTGYQSCVTIFGPSASTGGGSCHAAGFHSFELVYKPGGGVADLLVDGAIAISGYAGHALGLSQIPGIGWGAGSTCGTGYGEFNLVEFELPCVADVDDGSGMGTPDAGVTIDDLLYYLALFVAGDVGADVDDGSASGTADGGVTIDDLLYFLTRFVAGC